MASNKIKRLSNELVNHIGACEVLLRPSSALKELLENALDAKAKHIHVRYQDGGKTLLQVIDDGIGMNEADVGMCIQRHTTSKIENKKDLLQIGTYGFRGEALHALACVAELEIVTRTSESSTGTRLVAHESSIHCKETVTAPVGTQITVYHLFRNVPGRRNFLKSDTIESKHLIDEFQRVALARPDVAFTLCQNRTTVYKLPPTKLSHRIVHLFGKHYQRQLVLCDERAGSIWLHGYIGTPDQAKKTRGGQFFFVNNRYIKNAYLHHAVNKAFKNLIPEDSFPFYVLFINVPLHQVDVNVHPNKTEVRFEEQKLLYALIATCLRKALATNQCMHTIDFEQNGTQALLTNHQDNKDLQTPRPVELSYNNHVTTPLPISLDNKRITIKPLVPWTPTQASASPSSESVDIHDQKIPNVHDLPGKLQLHQKYILTQVKSGLLIINQRRAYERILYERYTQSITTKNNYSQKLLFGYKVHLQPADLTLFKACQDILYQLGFRFDVTHDEVTVTGHPLHELQHQTSNEHMITGLLEQYKRQEDMHLAIPERWIQALARRNNLPEYTLLQPEQMDSIVNQLFACKQPNYSLDGKRIWHIIAVDKLEALL